MVASVASMRAANVTLFEVLGNCFLPLTPCAVQLPAATPLGTRVIAVVFDAQPFVRIFCLRRIAQCQIEFYGYMCYDVPTGTQYPAGR